MQPSDAPPPQILKEEWHQHPRGGRLGGCLRKLGYPSFRASCWGSALGCRKQIAGELRGLPRHSLRHGWEPRSCCGRGCCLHGWGCSGWQLHCSCSSWERPHAVSPLHIVEHRLKLASCELKWGVIHVSDVTFQSSPRSPCSDPHFWVLAEGCIDYMCSPLLWTGKEWCDCRKVAPAGGGGGL